jgi:hypothetical protein
MKNKYKLFIGAFIVLAICFVVWLGCFSDNIELPVNQLIQGISIFVAIIAVVVALSSSDPMPRTVKISIIVSIDPKQFEEHSKLKFTEDLQKQYRHLPDQFRSYKVFFKVTNRSQFDLKKPTMTFELGAALRRPAIPGSYFDQPNSMVFHSNLYGSQDTMVQFWNGDRIILANSNFPFWNKNRTYEFWIEMVVDEVNYTPIEVLLAVNCDNAEGVSNTIKIHPADFLNK